MTGEKRRALVFGDSMIGRDADSVGKMAKAWRELLSELGYSVDVVGVGGSSVGNWLAGAFKTGGTFAHAGRWRAHAKLPLPRDVIKRTRLDFAAPDLALVVVNLGTNDAANLHALGRTSSQDVNLWLGDVARLLGLIPDQIPVVWTFGNARVAVSPDYGPTKDQLAAALKDRFYADVTVLVDDEAGAYDELVKNGVHPSTEQHRAFLASVRHRIPRLDGKVPASGDDGDDEASLVLWLLALIAQIGAGARGQVGDVFEVLSKLGGGV